MVCGVLVLTMPYSHLQVDPSCTHNDALPNITITMAKGTFITGEQFPGATFVLRPMDYIIRASNGSCVSTVTTAPSVAPTVLGFSWLRTYLSVFDIEKKRMGFARYDEMNGE